MQNIPIKLDFVPAYVRKPLKMVKNKREIYKVLFGTNAKTVLRHMKNTIALMAIGLYNAESIILSEKGFYEMAYTLSLFAVVTIQKNIRDTQRAKEREI